MLKKVGLYLGLVLLSFYFVGCNRLKGEKGDTGAAGANGGQGPSGPSGQNGQFFEFTGIMTSDGVVPIGQLNSDSLVAAFISLDTPPATHWFPNDGFTVDYQAGTVTFTPFLPIWSYKIIVIHNPSGGSSSSLL